MSEALLLEILAWCDDHPAAVEEKKIPQRAFTEMACNGKRLSEKQEAWIKDVHEKLFDVPQYENLISSGKALRGREVPTPAVLQNLPKRPPRRPNPTEE